ncbi:hypothetical protein N9937_00820 [bacterium]|nr:hypothetical protein [bacterium]
MHKAIVARIAKVEAIQGADRIQVAYVLGEAVIVQKTAQVGDIGVFFQPDLQLSEEFCHENNLFRKSERNKDTTQKGFFENNRRVRAQPFLKVKSEGFFCPLNHLVYTGTAESEWSEGTSFDEVGGHKICQKFISEKTKNAMAQATGKKKLKAVETPLFARHVDTEQFKYYVGSIPKGAVLSFHDKLHGTSARYSNTLVKKSYDSLTFWQKAMFHIRGGYPSQLESWEYVAGTRRVVLFEGQEQKEGFNGPEQWRFDWLEVLKPYLDKGLTVYGEIVGYANGSPIMGTHNTAPLKDKAFTKKYGETFTYSYGCHEGQNKFVVYRITQALNDGTILEYTPSQVIKWARDRGLEHTTRVHEDIVYDGHYENLIDLVEELTERTDVLCEDRTDPSHISEGIIIRVDGEKLQPKFYKNKSYAFKVCEGIYKETNVDVEDAS